MRSIPVVFDTSKDAMKFATEQHEIVESINFIDDKWHVLVTLGKVKADPIPAVKKKSSVSKKANSSSSEVFTNAEEDFLPVSLPDIIEPEKIAKVHTIDTHKGKKVLRSLSELNKVQ